MVCATLASAQQPISTSSPDRDAMNQSHTRTHVGCSSQSAEKHKADHTCTADSADTESSSGGSPTALDDRMPRRCGEFLSRCTFILRGMVSARGRHRR